MSNEKLLYMQKIWKTLVMIPKSQQNKKCTYESMSNL